MKAHIHVVLDRTGSMESIKDDAIGGFNEFVKSTRKKGQRWWVWLFDSQEIELLQEGVKGTEVLELTNESYQPRAATPLYDAVGQAIATAKEVKGKAKRNVLAVLTDGLENASVEWTADKVKAALKDLEADDWQVVFIAVGPEAWKEDRVFGQHAAVVKSAPTGAAASASYGAAANMCASYLSGSAASKACLSVDEDGKVSN